MTTIANLTDPEQIRERIRLSEKMLAVRPMDYAERLEEYEEIAALMERYLEVMGEPWRP